VLGLRDGVWVGPGGVGAAAEHLAGHDQAGCLRLGVEQVVAAMVYDRPHRSGLPDPDDGRDMPAVTVAADERLIEMEGIDQGDHVIGQQVVRDRAARMDGPAGTAEVGDDDPEVLCQGVDVVDIR
jgi:hypothetical protein